MEQWIQFGGLCLTILGTVGGLGFFFMKTADRQDLEIGAMRKEFAEIRRDVKKNSERAARIEGIIWADIDKVKGRTR